MSTRQRNEATFEHWTDLPGGGRCYWYDVSGHHGWRARYVKIVDASEVTLRFWQEIYDESGKLVETHLKFPIDEGHRKA